MKRLNQLPGIRGNYNCIRGIEIAKLQIVLQLRQAIIQIARS